MSDGESNEDHLPESDRVTNVKETPTPPDESIDQNAKVSFNDMFRYATKRDKGLQYIGLFAASLVGISQPLMFIIYGSMVDNLVTVGKFSVCDNSTVSYDLDVCLLTVMSDKTVKDIVFDPAALKDRVFFWSFWLTSRIMDRF